jgi:integrase
MSSAIAKPRAGKPLSAAFVRTVHEPGKYHDGGGLGLILRVEPSGSRRWVQRIVISGRRREIGLGTPPIVTLAAAREAALANMRTVQAGDDPIALRRNAHAFITFATAAEHAIAAKSSEFRSDKHRKQWRSTLDTYALPILGKLPIDQVGTADVLRVLQPIWNEKTETASRLRGRIEAILSWATAAGHREGENAARWKGNLSEMLPKPQRVAKTVHHPALASPDVSAWYSALRGRDGVAARALEFLTLTAARSGEVRGMVWGEVDLKAGVWTVPSDRMKASREHRVPLSAPALSVLESMAHGGEANPTDGGCPVFPAPRGGALSDMSLSAVMRRMQQAEIDAGCAGWLDRASGRPAVPHGLRSTFRDWTAERGFPRDMAEMALAHDVGSAVERAYRRSDMLERRRAMMTAWADFLDGRVAAADVVSFAVGGAS